jgi:hypothetical protein
MCKKWTGHERWTIRAHIRGQTTHLRANEERRVLQHSSAVSQLQMWCMPLHQWFPHRASRTLRSLLIKLTVALQLFSLSIASNRGVTANTFKIYGRNRLLLLKMLSIHFLGSLWDFLDTKQEFYSLNTMVFGLYPLILLEIFQGNRWKQLVIMDSHGVNIVLSKFHKM